MSSLCDVQPLVFWQQKRSVYNNVALIAGYRIAAPASQAYVERILLCAACCRQGDATACSLRLRCGCVWS